MQSECSCNTQYSCTISTHSCLQKLPSDLLNALDLQEIVAQKSVGIVSNPSKTKLEMFSEHIHTVLQDHGNLSPEYCNRVVAKELVKLVISSACTTLGRNGSNYFGMESSSMDSYSDFRDLKEGSDSDTGMAGFENVSGYMKWREAKRGSTVSAMSIESETFASREITTLPEEAEPNGSPETQRRQNGHKRVSVTKRPGIVVHKPIDEDDEVRIAAKKLVKKVLHYACKKWESLYRRSSVEYLTASTKRMKITESPSPPPTLFEEPSIPPSFVPNYSNIQPTVFQCNSSIPAPPETGTGHCESPSSTGLLSPPLEEREGSPTHAWRKLGKKRGRSESHELMMLKELDTFRRSKLGQKLQHMTDKFNAILKPQKALVKVQRASESVVPQDYISRDLLSSGERMSVKALTTNIGRMSIAEESGTDCDTDGDEEYTVLSPITKRPLELDTEVYDSDCDVSENTGGFKSLPATLNDNQSGSLEENDNRFTMSYPDLSHFQKPRAHAFMEDAGLYSRWSTAKEESDCHTIGQIPFYQSVPDMDFFIIVHTHPVPGMCQKFLCNNTNEVNLIYHCWLFPDLPFDPQETRSDWLEMGVFHPLGVQPVHLDLQDAGVTFYFLDPRNQVVLFGGTTIS